MGQRGPKSVAELGVVRLETIPRVRAPITLPEWQQLAINTLVATKPADFFQPCDMPLLVELVRHMKRADRIDDEIRKLEADDLRGLKWLAIQADRETRAIASLMRTLRLTPQSRYRPESKRTNLPADGPRPWEHQRGKK